jgi:hypothetical protein
MNALLYVPLDMNSIPLIAVMVTVTFPQHWHILIFGWLRQACPCTCDVALGVPGVSASSGRCLSCQGSGRSRSWTGLVHGLCPACSEGYAGTLLCLLGRLMGGLAVCPVM